MNPEFSHRQKKKKYTAKYLDAPSQQSFTVTATYILAWFGILIICGAYFKGDTNRGINNIYCSPPYGISIPFNQNTNPAFTFIQNFIHFSDARDRKPKGHKDYDLLFKVRFVLENIMKPMRTC